MVTVKTLYKAVHNLNWSVKLRKNSKLRKIQPVIPFLGILRVSLARMVFMVPHNLKYTFILDPWQTNKTQYRNTEIKEPYYGNEHQFLSVFLTFLSLKNWAFIHFHWTERGLHFKMNHATESHFQTWDHYLPIKKGFSVRSCSRILAIVQCELSYLPWDDEYTSQKVE